MATTLTDKGEILYASFPIDKVESNEDGDLVVFGKASDGQVDSDNQIVDPGWMAKAVQDWMSSGPNIRVQHSAQRDPAGVGLEASTDSMGNTWVRGLVVEPIAQKLVAKGALRAYSVGIARPTIVRDAMAPGGRITDGELVEVSLVDRPANKRCGIQLVKSENGIAEYVGKMFGDDAEIQKALDGDLVKMSRTSADMTFAMPDEDMTLTFTPNDLAKILKGKFIEQHYEELALKAIADAESEVYKRDVSTAERRNLASQGHALSDGSYPIANAGDLENAAILARSGHGNVSGAKALIRRRAKELGVANPLDDNNDAKKFEEAGTLPEGVTVVKNDTPAPEPVEAVKEAEPEVTKDPADAAPAGKKPKKGKKLPPWLNQGKVDAAKADAPANDGDGDDGDGDDDDTCKLQHAHTEKCMPSGTPQSASGAKDAAPMKEMPNPGAYQNSPMPAGRNTPDHKGVGASPETAALLRFKSVGIDADLGRLHDLTCPAYHPDEVASYHPFASLKSVVDTGLWQRKAVDAACGPIENAMTMTRIWQAAETLKSADMADLNDYRLELHKAFRDANPGPTTYPTPGMMSPTRFHRPCITDGHAALSPGYQAPNSSAQVATSPASVGSFDRPPLTAGHQSPSPSFMKGGMEYPSVTGVPQRLDYAHIEKEKARIALSMMHDHLAHSFPLACPMIEQDAYRVDNSTTPPPTVGVSRAAVPDIAKAEAPVIALPEAVFKAPGEEVDETLYKAFKKMRKKLGKRVLSGKMTVDEARSKLGRNFSQKDEEPEVAKAADVESTDRLVAMIDKMHEIIGPSGKVSTYTPDVIKSAVSEAVAPLVEQLTKAHTRIDEQQAALDAIANQPDPHTAAFTGLALNPVRKSARPAGALSQAEVAERTQQMIIRQLTSTWRTSDNPAEREAARTALDKFQGII